MVPNPVTGPARLMSIDFLRGCAVLGVVVSHSFPHEPDLAYLAVQSPWLDPLGHLVGRLTLGLPLFFVISGFCIHLPCARRQAATGEARLDFIPFWKRRIHRLYPPYLIALCICMLMVLAAYAMGRARYYPEPKLQWIGIDFIAHVFMLHGFHPLLDTGGGNPPMWSLAREELLYAMYFPLLAWRTKWGMPAALAGVLVLGLVFPPVMRSMVQEYSYFSGVIETSAVVLWIQWALGMASVEAHYRLVRLPGWCSAGRMVVVWLLISEICRVYSSGLVTAACGMIFFTLINFCVQENVMQSLSRHRLAVWLANVGMISYSLYLVHYPAAMILRELFGFIATPPNVWVAFFGMALKLGVGYCAAWLFYVCVERRFLNSPTRFYEIAGPVRSEIGR